MQCWTQLDDLDSGLCRWPGSSFSSHTHEQMQRKTTALEKVSKSIGLNIHPEKSEVLKVESKSREHGRLNGLCLKEVDSFCYLGSTIDRNGGIEH